MKSGTKKKRTRATITQTQRHAWVWRVFADPALSHPAKDVALVLGLLYFNDGQNGRCNPGYTGIANATCWARSAVVEAIEELAVGGWISFTSVGGGTAKNTNRYTIHWSRIATRPAAHDGAETSPSSSQTAAMDDVATRVAKYDAAHPGMSLRVVATALRVSKSAVHNARQTGVHSGDQNTSEWTPSGQGQPIDIVESAVHSESVHSQVVDSILVDTYPADIIGEKIFEGSRSRTPEGSGSRTRPPAGHEPLTSPLGKEVCGDALRAPSPPLDAAAAAHSASPRSEKFLQLLKLWDASNPNGAADKEASRTAFMAACDDGADPDAILAMANKHVAAMAKEAPRYFKRLDTWLGKQLWLQEHVDRSSDGKPVRKTKTTGNKKATTSNKKAAGNKKTTTGNKNTGGVKARQTDQDAALLAEKTRADDELRAKPAVVGDRVKHGKSGAGTVLEEDDDTVKSTLLVCFDNDAIKNVQRDSLTRLIAGDADFYLTEADRETQRLMGQEYLRTQRQKSISAGDQVRHIISGGVGTIVGDDVPGRANHCSVRSDKDGRVIPVDRQYLERLAVA
jgi:hypothetical protein